MSLESIFEHVWVPRRSVSPDGEQKDWFPSHGSFPGHTVDGRNPMRTTWKPWVKPWLVGIYRGIEAFHGFLGGAKWMSIHSAKGKWQPSRKRRELENAGLLVKLLKLNQLRSTSMFKP